MLLSASGYNTIDVIKLEKVLFYMVLLTLLCLNVRKVYIYSLEISVCKYLCKDTEQMSELMSSYDRILNVCNFNIQSHHCKPVPLHAHARMHTHTYTPQPHQTHTFHVCTNWCSDRNIY